MKSTAESPVKLPFKSDFTVKFECNSRYLRSFETKAATPKGSFRVRFPAGVPNKKRALGLFFVWLSVRKRTRGSSHCAAMARAQNNVRQTACADLREVFLAATSFKKAYGLSFVWLSVRKRTRGSSHCAAMAQKAKRRQFSMRRGMFKPRRGWRRWAPFSPPSRRGRRSPQRR